LGNYLTAFADILASRSTLLAIEVFSAFDFGLRYRRQVIFEHRVFNVCGLRTQGTFALDVEKVYVNLRIASARQAGRPMPLLTREALTGNRPIWDFLRQEMRGWAVVGAPGCGKSTLLQHIALNFAANRHRAFRMRACFPLLLFLREHIETVGNGEIALAELAYKHFANSARYPGLKPPCGWFARQLERGRAIVLLDGLDEVADAGKRQKMSEWVDRQISAYPHCRFIVTSRPRGYSDAPLQCAQTLEIQPFSWSQVKEFCRAWYLANEVLGFGKKNRGVLRKARRDAEDLINRLQQSPSLADLTVNPLLLTMVAMVHRYRGQLPGRRIELFAEICDVLLGSWRSAIGLQDSLTAAQKRLVLQPLAAAMMHGNSREIATSEALELIAEPLRKLGFTELMSGKQFLKDIETGTGLLSEKENDLWNFAHLSFQEYLAACHWTETQTRPNWSELAVDSWWHETLKLYAAQNDATALVAACLAHATVGSLTLALECSEEALILDEKVKQRVTVQIEANLESSDRHLRHMAAEVRLALRLKNLQRIDDNTAIDLEWIACAEYELFLDAVGSVQRPEHWPEQRIPPGSAKSPCLGVRAQNAYAFCLWLSAKTGHTYRLPSCAEIKAYPPRQLKDCGAWTVASGEDRLMLAWVDEGVRQDLEKRLQALSSLPVHWGGGLWIKENTAFQFFLLIYSYLGVYIHAYLETHRHELDSTYVRAREITRALACALDLNHDFSLDIDIDIALERLGVSDIILAINSLGAGDRILDRDLDLELGRILSLELDRLRVRDISFERALALDLEPDFHLDSGLGLALAVALDIDKNNQNVVDRLKNTSSTLAHNFAAVFRELLTRLETAPSYRMAIRYTARKIILLDLEMLFERFSDTVCAAASESESSRQNYSRFFRSEKRRDEPILIRDILLAWYWAFTIANARVDGKLPFWEGLRIVRERRGDEGSNAPA
jgi:hypothetical protein